MSTFAVVTGVLSDTDFLIKKMSEAPATKKALGKKGKSPVKGITNIKVEKLEFSNIGLEFLPDFGIHMFVTNKIQIGGKSFLGGRTELKLEINIITNSTLKKENVTCPTLRVKECKVVILDVKANLPKGILPNVMNNFLDKNLKNILPTTACPAVDYILAEVNKKLCIKDVGLPVGNSGTLHYVLSPVPTVTGDHVEMESNLSPGLQDYKIHIYVNKQPLVTISTSKALLHLYSTMEVMASSSESEPSVLFVIDLHMNFKIQSSIKENSLHSMFSFDKMFLSVMTSSVGDFEVQDLSDFISSLIKEVYSPVINGLTQTAIPLPDITNLLDMDFSKAEIEIAKPEQISAMLSGATQLLFAFFFYHTMGADTLHHDKSAQPASWISPGTPLP
ncbi:PREDICTED: BPI fold-containing family B member 6 [Nanorana parkeri]|uniref:BPI fold-containing family B member 6 n=1 Tax=Nanorana parkeri TaxID=125878 RepID=UPI0008550C55|nr:PREDICTED: BPI fold-containing family B member 6 [Nanorana parkeri]